MKHIGLANRRLPRSLVATELDGTGINCLEFRPDGTVATTSGSYEFINKIMDEKLCNECKQFLTTDIFDELLLNSELTGM
jgi:hypothetical protein